MKDKEQQIQKLNSILEKVQGMKKIITIDNIELKTQNQTTKKMRENQEKYKENLKIICEAKEKLQNLNKEQNAASQRINCRINEPTNPILNVKSTNNELEQQVTSLQAVNLELETTIHS